MRKLAGWVVAVGAVVTLVAGCGAPTAKSMTSKLQNEVKSLDSQNYKSTAMMTVQMDNTSQTYYVETLYEAPNTYRISLGDGNKNINQIIVSNSNGMFIVSPALQKVFRFNGNWAQNQGHIYLYDQILQQIMSSKDVSVAKSGNNLSFTMPMTSTSDVVKQERVDLNASTLDPAQVVLYDKDKKAVVSIQFTSFKTGVKFQTSEFDPHQLATVGNAAKTTLANSGSIGYIEPNVTFNGKLSVLQPEESDATMLRYQGNKGFTLEEWRPNPGVDGLVNAQLVDMYGVPALYFGGTNAQQMVWVNNGVEFALTSRELSLDEMQQVAMSTLSQVGK
ncbi:MAG: hypothetical protein A2201_13965 [Alicyclobacillus sp. RIFOXYA1_FULL_53_8]|nr:MAG: hypothetical protein A2201_13965 [Alicyclobacillus sp. RIFOXYA1_FULL_53_8]